MLATATMTQGFLDPTLEPHFRTFGVTPQIVGFIFLIMSAAYAMASPVIGWISGRVMNTLPIIITGLLITAMGFFLLGPSDFLRLPPSPLVSVFAMAVIGIAFSLALIPTFEDILDTLVEEGCPDNVLTYSLVSGWWASAENMGEMIGTGVGGFLIENFDFVIGANAMAFVVLVVALLGSTFYLGEILWKRRHGDFDAEESSERAGLVCKRRRSSSGKEHLRRRKSIQEILRWTLTKQPDDVCCDYHYYEENSFLSERLNSKFKAKDNIDIGYLTI